MSTTDFILTIHSLQRMEERFPGLVAEMTDQEIGELVHEEFLDALEAGRRNTMPPLELMPRELNSWWQRTPGAYVVWTEDKRRGYVIKEDGEEGTFVLTVLVGDDPVSARQKLKDYRV